MFLNSKIVFVEGGMFVSSDGRRESETIMKTHTVKEARKLYVLYDLSIYVERDIETSKPIN